MSKIEKRNLLSSIFVTLLIGLAYQEMVTPVRDSLRSAGFTFGTIALFAIFFLTSMRFFIGSQLHLLSEGLLKMKGEVWFFDFVVIVLEMVVLVFLGGVASVEASRLARIDFAGLLAGLYALDVLWIASQWAAGRLFPAWRRDFIPWAWAILNLVLVAILLVLPVVIPDLYSALGLTLLLLVNAAAFLIDVFLVDYFEVL